MKIKILEILVKLTLPISWMFLSITFKKSLQAQFHRSFMFNFESFYSSRFYIYVYDPFWFNFCILYKIGNKVHIFCTTTYFSSNICGKHYPFITELPLNFCQISVVHMCGSTSRFPILFHWSICLCWGQ